MEPESVSSQVVPVVPAQAPPHVPGYWLGIADPVSVTVVPAANGRTHVPVPDEQLPWGTPPTLTETKRLIVP